MGNYKRILTLLLLSAILLQVINMAYYALSVDESFISDDTFLFGLVISGFILLQCFAYLLANNLGKSKNRFWPSGAYWGVFFMWITFTVISLKIAAEGQDWLWFLLKTVSIESLIYFPILVEADRFLANKYTV